MQLHGLKKKAHDQAALGSEGTDVVPHSPDVAVHYQD